MNPISKRIEERIHSGPASDACGPDEAASEYISQQSLFVDQQTRVLFESAYGYPTFEEAHATVRLIESVTGLLFNGAQIRELEEIAAFAINYQIGLNDLIVVSEDVAINAQNEDDFIYSLATVVSLRVSNYLSDLNVASGGGAISEDFGQIAQTVERAIRDGRVSVRAGAIFEQDEDQLRFKGFGSPGVYHADRDELVFQIMEGGFSLFGMLDHNIMMFNTVVHECVHIYQDYLATDLSFMDSESFAYEISQKAQQLLEESAEPYLSRLNMDLLAVERTELAEFKTETVIGALRCRGYDETMIGFEQGYWEQKNRMAEEWIDEIRWELEGSDLGLSAVIYLDLLKIKHLYNVMNRYLAEEGSKLRETYAKLEAEPVNAARALSFRYNMTGQRLESSRLEFSGAESGGSQSALSARWYLRNLANIIVYSYYVEPEKFDDYTDEYIDMFDPIAEALLYENRPYDGL